MSVTKQTTTTPTVALTASAEQRVLACLKADPNHQGLRLAVKKTGCSGFSYVMDFVKAPKEADVILPLVAGYFIYIDKASLPYLSGLTIDYVKQGINHKFIYDNPNQTGQCGCGESFTVN